MIIVFDTGATKEQIQFVQNKIMGMGLDTRRTEGGDHVLIGVLGDLRKIADKRHLLTLPGVRDVIPISTPYKIAGRQFNQADSLVKVGNVTVGGGKVIVIAGPCAVENEEQIIRSAQLVKESGAVILRGGAFKPRTSPYAFQGLGEEGLKLMAKAREATGLPIVSEVTASEYLDLMVKYCDCLQVGARNMQNFELLKRIGQTGIPVLLKRGMSATIQDWLMAAEYILSEGNPNVILCERGIRTFEPLTRNTLDLSAVPVLKELTHLPIIVDPSHATGLRDKVLPLARAAVACGADGIMVEVHPDPDSALSDGPQSLYPDQFERLMREIQAICPILGRQLDMNLTISKLPSHSPGEGQVAFQGVRGAFSARAVRQFFGEDATPLPCETFEEVFEMVQRGKTLFAVVPLENSNGGSIHQVYDLLLTHEEIKICGEIRLRINQTLIGHPGANLDQINRVYSHPQGLAQCYRFLQAHPKWEQLPTLDTAGAVALVKKHGKNNEAAIASFESAKIYDMAVLAESIEDNPSNYTRFAVIKLGADEVERADKVSLVYATNDRPGALLSTLQDFADCDINLSKLESRPVLGNPLEHMFYVDMEVDPTSDACSMLMKRLEEKTVLLRDLGHYRKASHRIDR